MLKKLFIVALASLSVLTFTACDDNTSSSDNNITETSCQVLRINYGTYGEDVVFSYDCSGNKRIEYTTQTQALRQRESCSGFIRVNQPQEIRIGDYLVVRHRPKDADYTTSPATIRAREIEAYPSACFEGTVATTQVQADLNGNCNTCDFIK